MSPGLLIGVFCDGDTFSYLSAMIKHLSSFLGPIIVFFSLFPFHSHFTDLTLMSLALSLLPTHSFSTLHSSLLLFLFLFLSLSSYLSLLHALPYPYSIYFHLPPPPLHQFLNIT